MSKVTKYSLSNVCLFIGQREAVSDFLVALTSKLQPSMLLKLLRKLTVDVSKLSEYTTVALRLLTLHYDRCAKYYGSTSGGSSSDEEKRLTMMLFSNIFDSLSKMVSLFSPSFFFFQVIILIIPRVKTHITKHPAPMGGTRTALSSK